MWEQRLWHKQKAPPGRRSTRFPWSAAIPTRDSPISRQRPAITLRSPAAFAFRSLQATSLPAVTVTRPRFFQRWTDGSSVPAGAVAFRQKKLEGGSTCGRPSSHGSGSGSGGWELPSVRRWKNQPVSFGSRSSPMMPPCRGFVFVLRIGPAGATHTTHTCAHDAQASRPAGVTSRRRTATAAKERSLRERQPCNIH